MPHAAIRVLHVDDDAEFGDLTATVLEREDDRLSVETATSAAEGLELIQDLSPDCVVSDYDMPERDGIEFLRRVREDYPGLPFVLFTGKGSEEVASDAIAAGVTDYLQKGSETERYELLANRITNAVQARRSAERLGRQEKLLRLAEETADIGGWELALDTGELEITPGAGRLTGLSPDDDLSLETTIDLYHPDDRAAVRAAFDRAAETGEQVQGTWRIQPPNGAQRTVDVTVVPVSPNGEVTTLRGAIHDVTERRERERELRAEREVTEQALDTLDDLFYLLDSAGTIRRHNERAVEVTGHDPAELDGLAATELFPEGERRAIADAVETTLRDGETTVEADLLTADGERIPYEFTGARLTDTDGNATGLVGVGRDVTERGRRERRCQQLLKTVPGCVVKLDAEGAFVFATERAAEVLGLDSEELTDRTYNDPKWDIQDPSGTPIPDENLPFSRIRDTGEPVHGERLDVEWPDGTRKLLSVNGAPVFGEDGSFESAVFSLVDITDREERQRELERRRRERRKYKRMINSLHEAACIYDPEGRFEFVNEYLAGWYDTTCDELVGERSTLIPQVRQRADGDPYRELLNGDRDLVQGEVEGEFPSRGYAVLEYRLTPLVVDGTVEAAVGVARDVTERKEREQELEELTSQYRSLVDNFPNGGVFLFDEDLRNVRAGGDELANVGLSSDEIRGTKPHDLFPEEIADEHVHYFERTLAGESHTYQQAYRGMHYEIRTMPIRDAAGEVIYGMAVSRNITEQKERERQLEALNDVTTKLMTAETEREVAEVGVEAARDILDLESNAIHRHDTDREGLVPVAQTDASRELVGEAPTFTGGESIAWRVFESGDPVAVEDVREDSDRYNPDTAVRSELFLPISDHGILIAASAQQGAFDRQHVVLGSILASNIATALEQVTQQQRLRTQKRDLERQNERLEEFASVVSHDLRNPLWTAEGRLELAQADCDSTHLDGVAGALDRMDALIEDLLTLARGGETVGSTEAVSLSSLTEECWEVVPGERATLTVETERTVSADRSRLRQLLENLLANAVEHGGEDVTVRVADLADGFSVADDGAGIPEGERADVFEAGYSTAEEGTGFGLRITKQIVDAHGWDIRVTDSDDDGARFEITGIGTPE